MPKPTYKDLWNRAKNLEKENQELKQTVAELQAEQQLKKTEVALAASERSYRELVESANSMILRLDLTGNVKFINAFAQEFFGYPEKKILEKNVVGTIVPETESSGRNLATMIKDLGLHPERYINNENENMKSDGQKVWIAWTNKGIQNEAGNISEILCVGNEISQRRQAEKALIEKEAQLRTAIESLPFAFFALDETGRYIMQNAACKKHWGDLIGKRPKDLRVDKDTLALWEKNNRRAFAGEVVEGEVTLRPHGKEGFYHNIISPIHDGDRIRGILGVDIDITKRKRAEKALRESEAKFRALAESAPAAILILAGEKFLYVNPAFEAITGFTKEETLAIRFWELVHPDMREFVKERGLARQRGEAVPERYELKALTRDGQTRWTDLAATTIKYSGETATLATAYDITERRQAEDTLLVRERELGEKTHDLEEMNAALRVLLKKREDDRIELEEKIQLNVKELIQPYMDNLKKTPLSTRQTTLLSIIATNLAEIISPFARNFASIKYKLTPQEMQIASLIRQGKTTKEIAEIMNLSTRTIEFHRTKIREKIGLQSKKDNLQAHLLSLNSSLVLASIKSVYFYG